MFGLLESDIREINNTLQSFSEIECGIIFGSRAMGNYKRGSDIDLAIKGASIKPNTLYELSDRLNEECSLPYFFDLIHYEAISNPNLKTHIDTEGEIIYPCDEK